MDFSERISAERQARDNAERVSLRRELEQERASIEAAEEMYRELTSPFARQASEIRWPATPVVVTKVVERKVRTGLFSSRLQKETVFDRIVGKGWIVTDRDPNMQSSIGTSPGFLVMADGDWVDMSRTPCQLKNNVTWLSGMPAGLRSGLLIVLDTAAGPVMPFRTKPDRREYVERILIEELIFQENDGRQ